ncbi:unnamed protein product [Lactuca saligna]|uniref:Uncharacterized protein n=1 Tax=Lactuca saligna TaxID=75948 RepID=A0AA36EJ05_LACSI|nr:unnamed protein product [Lactuca saligna]
MASEQSFSYGGFRDSDLDLPTNDEIHALETQVLIEEMRDEMRQQLGDFREEIRNLKRKVTMTGVVGVAVMSLIWVCVCVECSRWGFCSYYNLCFALHMMLSFVMKCTKCEGRMLQDFNFPL